MNKLYLVGAFALAVTCMFAGSVTAQPADDPATCAVSATVDNIMEWEGNFAAIDLGHITAQATVLTGTAAITLWINGDIHITADNTSAAQLHETDDTLVTAYGIAYDGDGSTATGGSTVAYTAYDSFLTTASVVTHFDEDGAVEVTLSARAANDTDNVADAGSYTAVQTLTASWGSS
jgi:hypothetical protein